MEGKEGGGFGSDVLHHLRLVTTALESQGSASAISAGIDQSMYLGSISNATTYRTIYSSPICALGPAGLPTGRDPLHLLRTTTWPPFPPGNGVVSSFLIRFCVKIPAFSSQGVETHVSKPACWTLPNPLWL